MTFYGLFYVSPFFYFSLLLPTFLALVYIRQITNRIVDSKSIVYGRSMGPARPGAIWHWGDLTLLSSRWLLFLFLFHSSRRKMVPLNSWGKVLHFFSPLESCHQITYTDTVVKITKIYWLYLQDKKIGGKGAKTIHINR